MKIIIHRGTHQIGGVATEIKSKCARIIIDMGDELSMDDNIKPKTLNIAGVSDETDVCDGILITHFHGDHVGQLTNVRKNIPIYMGALTKDILLKTEKKNNTIKKNHILNAIEFKPGKEFIIKDIKITPFSIDHSACDSYMFLIEADGKRVLHTGDFRTHGFRGNAVKKILEKLVRKVDVLIIEGTTINRNNKLVVTERDLQKRMFDYIQNNKYVFVLCASTNLERICAIAQTVPRGKYFICDSYQEKLIKTISKHWSGYSPLFNIPKLTKYNKSLVPRFSDRGFVMIVRANRHFEEIIKQFDSKNSIILYSMWDGYRTKIDSNIPNLLDLANSWEYFHTSGHASVEDIKMVIETISPSVVIPIHTERPHLFKSFFPDKNIKILDDCEEFKLC